MPLIKKVKIEGSKVGYLDSFARKIHPGFGTPLEIENLLSYTT